MAEKLTAEDIEAICQQVWQRSPDAVSFPGGEGRKTALVHFESGSFAVSKRSSMGRAQLEREALIRLSDTGAVPDLLYGKGDVVVQQAINGQRLSEALELADRTGRDRMLIKAGQSLFRLRRQARDTGLENMAPDIGIRSGWAEDMANVPLRLAEMTNVALEGYDPQAVAEIVRPRYRGFVKWDARPGNALVTDKGGVIWFDWEHCGVGSVEDDLVWLLADEWCPISAVAEETLLQDLERETGSDLAQRFHYKAVMHSVIRLSLILDRKGDGPWWSVRESLQNDRIGVSLAHVTRVAKRASVWAGKYDDLAALVPFLRGVHAFASQL